MRDVDLKRALAVRTATAPRLGPRGEIYYLSDVTGVMQLWQYDGSTHDVVAYIDGRVGDYRISQDGTIALTCDKNGDENWQIYLNFSPISTEGVNNLGAWSPSGGKLAFTSTRGGGSDFHLYIYDGDGVKRVAELSGVNVVEEWSELGIFITHYETNLESTILLYREGEVRELTPRSAGSLARSPKYVGGGKFMFLTNIEWEYVGVALMDVSTGSWKYVIQLDRDVEHFDVWGNYMAFVANEEGNSGLYYMHIPSGLTYKIATATGVITSLQYRDGKLLFSLSSINRGHEVYLYRDGVVRQITNVPKYRIPLDKIPPPSSVRFPTHDGRKIHANLYWPVDKPVGTVVYLHGGPESQDRPEFKPLTLALLTSGFTVAAPNYRGSTGFGKSFTHLDDGERRWDAIRDVGAFAKWLHEEGVAREKPCVIGSSYGGYLTLMALAVFPDLWKCGVEIAGMFNLVTFLERTAPWRRKYREAEYGFDRDMLLQLSPATHVEKIQAPLLAIHGANDVRVPIYEAEQLVTRLRELGRKVELITLPDEGHVIAKVENRIRVYTAVVKFIQENLSRHG